jgi:hypothetical protein
VLSAEALDNAAHGRPDRTEVTNTSASTQAIFLETRIDLARRQVEGRLCGVRPVSKVCPVYG